MKFTTRVELHQAGFEDYNRLHQEMALEGFSRTITSDDGRVYHLPTAEYNIDANLTFEQVRDRASRAAAKTHKAYAVLVTEGQVRAWVGLQEVQNYLAPSLAGLGFGLR